MSQYTIEIDDAAIIEQANKILNATIDRELRLRYSGAGEEISAAVKDLIYSRKNEIIDMVVDRATKEIVRKGLPKLMEKMSGGADHGEN